LATGLRKASIIKMSFIVKNLDEITESPSIILEIRRLKFT
jgi:hypothetical protein